jgi:hypothetical protein
MNSLNLRCKILKILQENIKQLTDSKTSGNKTKNWQMGVHQVRDSEHQWKQCPDWRDNPQSERKSFPAIHQARD